MGRQIAIAGNIGAGKTTLSQMLSKHYGWEVRLEPVVENPYLDDFYKDIKRWSFAMEVYFLKQRMRDLIALRGCKQTVIQDRTIYEGVYVFVENNYHLGNLCKKDYETFMELFNLMEGMVDTPDLMIYLRTSVPQLVGHIQMRGRDCEQTLQLEYLKGLNERYDDFIYNKYHGKVMTVEMDGIDFEHNAKDFEKITDRIDAELFGLFSDIK